MPRHKRRLREKIAHLEREYQELRDRLEPEIARIVAVAVAGPNQLQVSGYTRDGRWVSRIEQA